MVGILKSQAQHAAKLFWAKDSLTSAPTRMVLPVQFPITCHKRTLVMLTAMGCI